MKPFAFIYWGSFAGLVFCKLAGLVTVSWWIVLLPLAIPAAFFFLVAACMLGTLAGIAYIITRKR